MNIFQPQRIYLHLAIIALVLLSLLTYSYSYHADMMRTAVNLIEAAERIKGEVTTAHIRLEDIISGHRHKDDMADVRQRLGQADWFVQAVLHGGTRGEETFPPVQDANLHQQFQKLGDQLVLLGKIAEKRFETAMTSATGTRIYIDQEYEAHFTAVLAQAEEVEENVHQYLDQKTPIYRLILLIRVFIILSLFVMAIVLIHRHRRYLLEHTQQLEKEINDRR